MTDHVSTPSSLQLPSFIVLSAVIAIAIAIAVAVTIRKPPHQVVRFFLDCCRRRQKSHATESCTPSTLPASRTISHCTTGSSEVTDSVYYQHAGHKTIQDLEL